MTKEPVSYDLSSYTKDEGKSFGRILQLRLEPMAGVFDAPHLNALHAYIFQDSPEHRPGQTRPDAESWVKNRVLEGTRSSWQVPYLSQNINDALASRLEKAGGPDGFRGLSIPEFSSRMAGLYGDLDFIHPYSEGNSRTLREFTRSLAAEARFRLDWPGPSAGMTERNQLYLARDREVLERRWPDLTEELAMRTDSREEYEAWFLLEGMRRRAGSLTLAGIIEARTSLLPEVKTGPAVAAGQDPFSRLAGAIGSRAPSPDDTVSASWLDRAQAYSERRRPVQDGKTASENGDARRKVGNQRDASGDPCP